MDPVRIFETERKGVFCSSSDPTYFWLQLFFIPVNHFLPLWFYIKRLYISSGYSYWYSYLHKSAINILQFFHPLPIHNNRPLSSFIFDALLQEKGCMFQIYFFQLFLKIDVVICLLFWAISRWGHMAPPPLGNRVKHLNSHLPSYEVI